MDQAEEKEEDGGIDIQEGVNMIKGLAKGIWGMFSSGDEK